MKTKPKKRKKLSQKRIEKFLQPVEAITIISRAPREKKEEKS